MFPSVRVSCERKILLWYVYVPRIVLYTHRERPVYIYQVYREDAVRAKYSINIARVMHRESFACTPSSPSLAEPSGACTDCCTAACGVCKQAQSEGLFLLFRVGVGERIRVAATQSIS